MANRISIRSGATALPEESIAHLDISFIGQNGVEDKDGGHWKVIENNPQNLSVNVQAGKGFFVKTGMTYHGYSDSSVNISITANSSGNDRIDAIVAYVDLGTTPNSDASNILKFVAVQGTPSTTPQAPTDGEIQTSIGAGNPFIRLADVYVANGATAITNSEITDKRDTAYITYKGGFKNVSIIHSKLSGTYQNVYSASVSGTVLLDALEYNVFSLTLTGNTTLQEPSNMEIGQAIEIEISQDATGGRSLTWWSGIKWPDGVEPVLTTTANKIDAFLIRKVGTNSYLGFIIGQNL